MPKKNKVFELAGNKYRLLKNIGDGGSGTVWSTEHNDQLYAVKFINSEVRDKIIRFEREISFCKKTTHRNIIKVIADGYYNDTPCYVMPYYSETFRQVIKREINFHKLVSYILEICKGIRYIHSKGIIHRDIKPENIFVKDSSLVLADFGIAHFKDSEITSRHELLANRNYMAPEQKIKNNSRNIDKNADIYAFGVIINECFTKKNLGGTWHQLIASDYPLLADLDLLVSNMIRQNPEERPDIATVETEIKFICGRVKSSFLEVSAIIREDGYPQRLRKSLLKSIFNRATEDILIGKHLFYSCHKLEMKRYNRNWHKKIAYSVDDFLHNLYVQEKILALCKGKFEYESNVYRKTNWHNTLNLDDNEDHKALYQRLSSILDKYRLFNSGESLFDLTGKSLKYFASCADYHCKEILEAILNEEKWANENLKDAPILWIVDALKWGISETLEYLIDGIDGLGGKYDFLFEEHISIDWKQAEQFNENRDDDNFFDENYLKDQLEEQKILNDFRRIWKVRYSMLDKDYCSIKFNSNSQYQKFKNYALEVAKPHYIFEGDVLEMFADANFVGSIVELQLSRAFAIPHTLAGLLGIRDLNL
jgi:serine/threonine protein kinase